MNRCCKAILPLALAALAQPTRCQGLATLLARAGLVVEARVIRPGETTTAQVRRVLKGPVRLSRVRLFLPHRVSAHQAPRPGEWTLLFLCSQPAWPGTWLVIQTPLGAVGEGRRDSALLLAHARRLARHRGAPEPTRRELLRGLAGPSPILVESAALDLVTLPGVLAGAPPDTGKQILARLHKLSPRRPAAAALVHVVGALRPAGWERELMALLRGPGARPLAPTVGLVLGARLGDEAVGLLARAGRTAPGAILALGATGRPAALGPLGQFLADPATATAAAQALVLHRSSGACELLSRARR